MNKMKLYCCGSRGSWPVEGHVFNEFGGNTSCYVLKVKNYALVIDVGTGFYSAQNILKDCEVVDVVLTHLHYDHILGLLDWTDFQKSRLTFYGSFKEWLGDNSLSEFFRKPFWPVAPEFITKEIPKHGEALELPYGLEVRFYPSAHPNGSKELIITSDEHKIVVMFDNEDPNSLDLNLIKNADILIYDGMYHDDEYPSKKGYGHSTFQEGARLALKAKPNRLIITHHNPANEDTVLNSYEELAKQIYPHTNFARAGQTWEFPMPKPLEESELIDYVDLNLKEKLSSLLSPFVKIVQKYGQRQYYTLLLINMFFAAFALIFTIVDFLIIKNIPYQIFFTIAALFTTNSFLLYKKPSSQKTVELIFAIESFLIMTALLVTTNNIVYGFSWYLLIPVGGFFVFGLKRGTILAVVSYINLLFLLNTTFGNSFFGVEIPEDAGIKLPMLFFNYMAVCAMIESVRYTFSKVLQKTTMEQETKIQEQTQELRDRNYSLLATNQQLQMRNELLSKTFGSFLPDEAVLKQLKSDNDTTLKSEKREVTILKCGIREFSNIIINDNDFSSVEMLNYHFDQLSQIVERRNGLVLEYIGDSFVAIFGALKENKNHADDAVACAMEIQKEMENIKKHCIERGFKPYEVGIGVNTGVVILGAFGSTRQLKYGIIGRASDISITLEKEAKKGEVLVSAECVEKMESTVHITDISNTDVGFDNTNIEYYKIDGIGIPYCISLKD